MEKQRKYKFTHKYQRRYLYVVTILLGLFFVFQLVGNFTNLLATTNNQSTDIQYHQLQTMLADKNSLIPKREQSYVILGDPKDTLVQITSSHLQNIKLNSRIESEMAEVFASVKGIFICKQELLDREIEELMSAAKRGISLYFLTMPHQLNNEDLRQLLGIQEIHGTEQKWGVRFISNFMIGEMKEYQDYYLAFQEVKLSQGTKVYAYSLGKKEKELEVDKQIRNEDLPPLIWRNSYRINAQKHSLVFVVNMDSLMNTLTGPGIITGMLSQSESDFMYPVINGYHLVIKGLPILNNFQNEKLMQLYGKDALRIQQDILIPQISSFLSKYQLRPTYLIAKMDVMNRQQQKILEYHLQQVRSQAGELIYFHKNLTDLGPALQQIEYQEETSQFTFYEKNKTSIPLLINTNHYQERDELSILSSYTAYGYLSLYIDTDELLTNTNELNWVSEGKKINTILAMHQKKYSYLQRNSISSIIMNLLKYQLLEPAIHYEPERITLQLDYFTDVSYFILKTPKVIREVVNGSYQEIGFQRYLITLTEDTAQVIFH